MTGTAQRETPQVAIFWLVRATEGEARLLAAGCPLDQAEPYGDCLTYGPGHYETWVHWRRDKTVDPALRAWCGCTNTKTGRADASSSTGRAIYSSFMPMASS
jgi:hypothetical protein